MTTNPDHKRNPAPDRAERLKAALRENLKRRKAQTRARAEPAAGDAGPGDRDTPPAASRPGDEDR